MTEYFAEFIGTLVLIVLGCGVNGGVNLTKSYAQGAGWIVITIGWGLAVTMAIYAVGRISGAHINPAVTLGLAMSGDFELSKVPGYVTAQMLGAITGATLVWLNYLPHWKNTEDPSTKLGVFSNSPAYNNPVANLFSEILSTTVLLFVIMLIGANEFAKGFNPIAIGALITAIGMSLGGTTGFAINPARDLGPRIAHFILPIDGKGSSGWGYSWVPVIGPLIGGVQGTLLYNAIFLGSYSTIFYLVSGFNLLLIVSMVVSARKS